MARASYDGGSCDVNEAACIYELFNIYATWRESETVYGPRPCGGVYAYHVDEGGMYARDVQRLLQDLNLLDGVPEEHYKTYVGEHMLRADQDGDGMLSISEFVVWFVSEVAVMLPFKRNGMGCNSCAPLYNRFLYYMLLDSGAGVRKKAVGLRTSQLLRMCQDYDITGDAHAVRLAALAACSDRVQSKVEGGSRLEFPQFIRALDILAGSLGVSLESALYRIVGDATGTFVLRHHKVNRTVHQMTLDSFTSLFLESELEQPLRWSKHRCEVCGDDHSRWVISDTTALKAYFQAAGMPYLPEFRIVNARNIRAVFHKYNLKYNSGALPSVPADKPDDSLPGKCVRLSSNSLHSCKSEQLSKGTESTRPLARPPTVDVAGLPNGDAEAAGSCCTCQHRSMTLMELPTFMKLCGDNRTISQVLGETNGRLKPQQLEAAFRMASSVGGLFTHAARHAQEQPGSLTRSSSSASCRSSRTTVHACCSPSSSCQGVSTPSMGRSASQSPRGIPQAAPMWLGSPRPGGAPSPVNINLPPSPSRHVNHSLSATPSSSTRTDSGRASPMTQNIPTTPARNPDWPLSPSAQRPCSPSTGAPALCSSASSRSYASEPASPNRNTPCRQPEPTLSFPQFLEALRLLAEQLIGHPQVLASMELALWGILHDVAEIGCPLPISPKRAKAARLLRQQQQ